MADIVFHSMAGSSYLWTAMQIADEKGVPYRLEELTLGSPEHLKLHPFSKMPILQHGDVFLYESLAIAHYIDRAFPGPALQPLDPLGQANMLRWISIVNSYVFPIMNRFFKERIVRPSWGFEPDYAFIESALEPLKLQMRLIDEAVSQQGFLAGERLTIADCFLFPILLFFALTKEGAAFLERAKSTADWLTRLQARPSHTASAMRLAFDAMKGAAEALYQTPPSTRITAPVV